MEEKKLTDEELNELIKKLEYQSWAQNFYELSQAAYMLKYQKAEIERLTEENAELQKEIERLKDENCHDYHCMCLAQQEKAELQKQVDELKEEMHKIESAANETYMLGFEEGEKQAVKDTAKELIEEIDNVKEIFPNDIVGYEQAQGWCMCIDKLKEIAKNKGVEVE